MTPKKHPQAAAEFNGPPATRLKHRVRQACPLCGSDSLRELLCLPLEDRAVRQYLHGCYGELSLRCEFGAMAHRLARCKRCDFVWQMEILDAESMEFLYSQLIPSEESREKQRRLSLRQREHFAVQMIALGRLLAWKKQPLRVLDFGMGWGEWLLMARAFGFPATGIDLSEERVQNARAAGLRAFTSLREVAGEDFDVINLEQVLEHVDEPAAILRELVERLDVGGVLRIAVPDAAPELAELAGGKVQLKKGALQPLEHINAFTPETLEAFGRAHGLRRIDPRVPKISATAAEGATATLRALLPRSPVRSTTSQYFVKPLPPEEAMAEQAAATPAD